MSAARVLLGVALAEAASWTGLYQRALLLPYWTRRKRREIEDDHDREGSIEWPVPFALNQPTAALRGGPGPRSEWVAFQLRLLAASGGRYDLEAARRAWLDLAAGGAEPPRLSIAQRSALDALRAGGGPPWSGHDHPHYFDDAAAVRAIALGAVLADDLDALRAAVRADAPLSNAEDGIWAAEAVALAVAHALRGAAPAAVVDAARTALPTDSWIGEATERALRHAAVATDALDLALRLDHDLANAAYSYFDAAPDVVPIALAIFRRSFPHVDSALWAAAAVPRHAGAVLPLVGALCAAAGADAATAWPPLQLRDRVPSLLGVALPQLRGLRLSDLSLRPPHDEGD